MVRPVYREYLAARGCQWSLKDRNWRWLGIDPGAVIVTNMVRWQSLELPMPKGYPASAGEEPGMKETFDSSAESSSPWDHPADRYQNKVGVRNERLERESEK
jgi:hypothetical protein